MENNVSAVIVLLLSQCRAFAWIIKGIRIVAQHFNAWINAGNALLVACFKTLDNRVFNTADKSNFRHARFFGFHRCRNAYQVRRLLLFEDGRSNIRFVNFRINDNKLLIRIQISDFLHRIFKQEARSFDQIFLLVSKSAQVRDVIRIGGRLQVAVAFFAHVIIFSELNYAFPCALVKGLVIDTA